MASASLSGCGLISFFLFLFVLTFSFINAGSSSAASHQESIMPFGISNPNQHYYHLEGDATQMKTAQRGTFVPTASNKLSNRFLQSDNKLVRGFGGFIKSMRQTDLTLRGAGNRVRSGVQGASINCRAGFEKMSGDQEKKAAAEEKRQSSQASLKLKTDLKHERLNYKKTINAAEPGKLDDVVAESTRLFQSDLEDKGFEPSGGLAQHTLPRHDKRYLRNDDFHAVAGNYATPGQLRQRVATAASRQHDNGDMGTVRALKRSIQYGAIGVSNGFQLGKQGMYAMAATLAPAQSEERDSFSRAADKARDQRHLGSAALDGNIALTHAFNDIGSRRSADVEQQLVPKGYRPVQGETGAPPRRTSYLARKLNTYFARPGALEENGSETASVRSAGSSTTVSAPAEAGDSMSKRRKAASFLVSLANVKPHLSAVYQGKRARWAEQTAGDPGHPEARQGEGRRAYHAAKRDNANFIANMNRAAVQGRLREALQEQQELQDEELKEATQERTLPSDAFAGYYETDMKQQIADQTEDNAGFEYDEAARLAAYAQLLPAKKPAQRQQSTFERTRHEEAMSPRMATPLSVTPQNPWTNEPDFSLVDFDEDNFFEEFPESRQLASQMALDATGRQPRQTGVIADSEHRYGDGQDVSSPWSDVPTRRGGKDDA